MKLMTIKSFKHYTCLIKPKNDIRRLGMATDKKRVERELKFFVSEFKRRDLKGVFSGDWAYAYYPNEKFTKWTASDGSEIKQDLLGFLIDYIANRSEIRIHGLDCESVLSEYGMKKKMNQESFELAKMNGDLPE